MMTMKGGAPAWESVDPEIFVRSFLKCGISNGVECSKDNQIWVKVPVTTNINNEGDDQDPLQDINNIKKLHNYKRYI